MQAGKHPWTVIALVGLFSLLPNIVRADQLRLVQREGGNRVEVVEEQADSFVVKIPKGEIALIKRETPTEIKLWKEKKILWEDQGDYLVLSLPKERIAPPPTSAEESPDYSKAPTLEKGLSTIGAKGQTSGVGVLTGNITGRALRGGRPLAGCLVRLSAIQGTATELTRLLGGKKSTPASGPNVIGTTTGANGVFLFDDVPIGDYDISWLPPGSSHWLGRLSDKPDVTVQAGEVTQQGDIEL